MPTTDRDEMADGRRENAAQPLGERPGLASDKDTRKVAEQEKRSAGPDGPDAREVGDSFKRDPASHPSAPD